MRSSSSSPNSVSRPTAMARSPAPITWVTAGHVAVEMLRVWSKDLAAMSKLALDAGIDERRIQISESEGHRLHEALNRASARVGIADTVRSELMVALAAELRGGGA
jgi:hypothetical protein